MGKQLNKAIETITWMAQLISELPEGTFLEMDIDRMRELVKELKEEEKEHSMKSNQFKGKEVILFYKVNEETEVENPVVTILDEVEGFGLYVETEDGSKEVVAFTELSGWRETNQDIE